MDDAAEGDGNARSEFSYDEVFIIMIVDVLLL
jgi:hypothetical protein